MVFNATLNNISAISWRSVLWVEKTRVLRKKPPTCRKLDNKLSHIISVYLDMSGIRANNFRGDMHRLHM